MALVVAHFNLAKEIIVNDIDSRLIKLYEFIRTDSVKLISSMKERTDLLYGATASLTKEHKDDSNLVAISTVLETCLTYCKLQQLSHNNMDIKAFKKLLNNYSKKNEGLANSIAKALISFATTYLMPLTAKYPTDEKQHQELWGGLRQSNYVKSIAKSMISDLAKEASGLDHGLIFEKE